MGLLRVDLWNALFIAINLFVLYLLMKKFLVKPIMDVMQKRDEMIKSGLKNAADKEEEANELKSKWENELRGVNDTAEKIMEQSKKDAKAEYERIMDSANKNADEIIAAARAAAETERENALSDAKSQISELAVLAVEKILDEKSSAGMDTALYDGFLAEAGGTDDSE